MNNVLLNIDGPIATICLDNPDKHNSLAGSDIEQFIAHLNQVEQSPEVRALIITSSEGKTFCAGASLTEMGSGNLSGEIFERLTNRLAAVQIPTICAMNGSAYGGGSEIGLCCDFRIGIKGMRLFVPASRFGLCYPLNGIQRYVHKLGPDTAKRLLIASEEFHGESLLALGYLTHLVEPEEINEKARSMAEGICRLGPIAVRTMKTLCDQAAAGILDQEAATLMINHCNQSNDLQEGLAAAREKRTPVFSGN
ncbi:enoyl-CoA hydratase/isomerase family protein [Candidatus Pelagadaptatus aseana]|uniref:enoyl-CoA hydratase/isomerase family protein n=1 Tax=Candidatus Pelagadaptatus aseana TaxID=3120508 RepID=UPI003C6EEFA0